MKSLLILLLVFALAAALFLTRPTKADFEKYMQKVNEQISAGMEQGAASSIITLS